MGIHWPVPTASDRLKLGTPEQAGQDRYKRIVADPQQLDALLVELFLDSYAEAPEEIERVVGQMRQRWPHMRGLGLLPRRADGMVRGAGRGGLRVRIGAEPPVTAGVRSASGGWWARRNGCRAKCAGTPTIRKGVCYKGMAKPSVRSPRFSMADALSDEGNDICVAEA